MSVDIPSDLISFVNSVIARRTPRALRVERILHAARDTDACHE